MSLKLILWFKSDSQTDGQTRNESPFYHMRKFYALFFWGGIFSKISKIWRIDLRLFCCLYKFLQFLEDLFVFSLGRKCRRANAVKSSPLDTLENVSRMFFIVTDRAAERTEDMWLYVILWRLNRPGLGIG